MKRTTAPNSAGGLHVDKVPGVTVGTTGIAEDRNNLQEEICNAIEGVGLTLSGANDEQLKQTIVAYSHGLGERVESFIEQTIGILWPAVRMDDADHDIASANYPTLVTALRAIKLKVNSTTDYTGTVAGSVITLATTTAGDKWLAALAEEQAVHGSYTAWLCVNVAGTDYVITNVNAGARTITVTGSPTTGSQTVIIYPYRIAGSSTTARLRRDSARAFIGSFQETADGTADRALCAGMRARDRMQGHWHISTDTSGGGALVALSAAGSRSARAAACTLDVVTSPANDGVSGVPRTGLTTDPRTIAGAVYMWGQLYVP
jgi:surface antigen